MTGRSNRLMSGIRRSFGAGVIVLVPLLLTIWIIEQLFNHFKNHPALMPPLEASDHLYATENGADRLGRESLHYCYP